jgi:hypothetical protein
MADTQRTRAQQLALFADNVTGEISPQDLRDFLVTVMEEEFANPGDFWKQPETRKVTTDASAKGWKDYSQIVGSDCSAFNVLYLTVSGEWKKADVAASAKTGVLAMAMDSYTSGQSTCIMLREGIVYYSAWSATFSGYIGRPIYLASGVAGSITVTKTTQSELVIGFPERSDDGGTAIGKFRFKPEWAVRGV